MSRIEKGHPLGASRSTVNIHLDLSEQFRRTRSNAKIFRIHLEHPAVIAVRPVVQIV